MAEEVVAHPLLDPPRWLNNKKPPEEPQGRHAGSHEENEQAGLQDERGVVDGIAQAVEGALDEVRDEELLQVHPHEHHESGAERERMPFQVRRQVTERVASGYGGIGHEVEKNTPKVGGPVGHRAGRIRTGSETP